MQNRALLCLEASGKNKPFIAQADEGLPGWVRPGTP